MAVNCVLPFLHAFAQLRGDTNLGRLALKVYREFPKLQENELTREMRRELIDSISPASPGDGPSSGSRWDKVVDNARRQQGLLQLHHLSASP